jgi:hypothetical protein
MSVNVWLEMAAFPFVSCVDAPSSLPSTSMTMTSLHTSLCPYKNLSTQWKHNPCTMVDNLSQRELLSGCGLARERWSRRHHRAG